jgi:hypothetical protein
MPRELIFPILSAAIAGTQRFRLDVTPPAVHHEIALEAFAAGLHVIGEKPLSDTSTTPKSSRKRAAMRVSNT